MNKHRYKYNFGGLHTEAATVLEAFIIFLFFWVLSMAISSLTIPYILNSWLEFFGKEQKVLWWHGALFGIIPRFGYYSVIISIITWILMLFLN